MKRVFKGLHGRPVVLGALVALGISFVSLLVGNLVDSVHAGAVAPAWWVLAVAIALVVAVADGARVASQATDALEGEQKYRNRVIRSIFRLGGARVSADRQGRLVSLATDGAERVAAFRDSFTSEVAVAATQLVIYLVFVAVAVNPLVALGLALGAVLTGLGISGFMRWRRKSSAGNRRARSAVAASYLEAIRALETLSLLRATDRTSAHLEKVGEAQRRETMGLLARNQQLLLIIDLLVHGVFLGFGVTLTLLAMNAGWISVGAALTAVLLTVFLIEPIDLVGSFFYVAMAGRGIERAMIGLQKQAEGVPGVGEPLPALTTPPRVRVENVSYSYPPRASKRGDAAQPKGPQRATPGGEAISKAGQSGNGTPSHASRRAPLTHAGTKVLSAVDFNVAPGTFAAITGPSGVGKTTLLNVLSGRLPIQSGRVQVGDYEFSSEDAAGQELAAFVSQNTWLMTGTLRDNLAFANPDATDEQMWQALQRAHLADEMRALSDGLDTVLGEDGAALSGGQAQRVALARAYLSGRPLIMADEPTAHVDLESQREIMRSLLEARGDHTIILVTHREAVASQADQLIRLEPVAAGVVHSCTHERADMGEHADRRSDTGRGGTPADLTTPAHPHMPANPVTPADPRTRYQGGSRD